MLEIAIPGHQEFRLSHLVLDYNGTLACDGQMIEGVGEVLRRLAEDLHIHIVTADTFGSAAKQLADCPGELVVLPPDRQDAAKRDYVRTCGPTATAAVGNGRNDRLMLAEAALGIAVIQREGASKETLMAADVVCSDILSALELLTHPLRLVASLRL